MLAVVQHIDGSDPDRWEGIRVQFVGVMPDKTVLAADTHRRLRSYKFEEQLDFDMYVTEFVPQSDSVK